MSDRVPGPPALADEIDPNSVARLLPGGSALRESVLGIDPFTLDWGSLASVDGWSVWLGHPPVPDGIAILPVAGQLIWGDPADVIGTAVAASLAYARIRGADSFVSAAGILQREGPISLLVPGDLSSRLAPAMAECTALGVPVVSGSGEVLGTLDGLRQRRTRRQAHRFDAGRSHDPALSAQRIDTPAGSFGGNSLSSFVLHDEGEIDQVQVTGTPSERMGVEIGVRGEGIDLAASLLMEDDAARIPGFLAGVTSQRTGSDVTIGWSEGATLDPQTLGAIWQTWLKAIWGATLVDVRIAFAPAQGRSALLVDMRTRSSQFHTYRAGQLDERA